MILIVPFKTLFYGPKVRGRLQAQDWHSKKNQLILLKAAFSNKGNVCGLYQDPLGYTYIHWMNPEEQVEFFNNYYQNSSIVKALPKDFKNFIKIL